MPETENKEREWCGMKISTWAKVTNMGLGVLMILWSVFTFFSINLGSEAVIAITFKAYSV